MNRIEKWMIKKGFDKSIINKQNWSINSEFDWSINDELITLMTD